MAKILRIVSMVAVGVVIWQAIDILTHDIYSPEYTWFEEGVKPYSLLIYSPNITTWGVYSCNVIKTSGLGWYLSSFDTAEEAENASLECKKEFYTHQIANYSDRMYWCKNNPHLTYEDYNGCRLAEEKTLEAQDYLENLE